MSITDLNNINKIMISPLITPDTQRDAVNIKTQIPEGHNHCKSTSCVMALNWIGQHYPSAKDLASMGEYSYNSILLGAGFLQAGEKIQDWQPHIRAINQLLRNANVPIKPNFVNFRRNYNQVVYSLLSGRPVVLGTMITSAGHIVLLVGMTEAGNFVIIDPYGDAVTGYKNTKADYYIIAASNFERWVDGSCNCIYFTGL